MSQPKPHVVDVTSETFDEQVVRASHAQPVLVDFWADWCGPCKALAPTLERLAAEYGGAFVLAKVDTEAEQALAMQHGIRSLPTVRLFANGAPVEEFMGVQPESAVRALLDRHVQRGSDAALAQALEMFEAGDVDGAVAALQKALLDDPSNTRIHPAFARVLLARGTPEDAEAVLNALPAEAQASDEVRALRSEIAFAGGGAEDVDSGALREQVEASPKDCALRMQLANALVQSNRHVEAMDELLEVLRIDRGFDGGAARTRLLQLFDLLGASPVVADYRRKMAQVLF